MHPLHARKKQTQPTTLQAPSVAAPAVVAVAVATARAAAAAAGVFVNAVGLHSLAGIMLLYLQHKKQQSISTHSYLVAAAANQEVGPLLQQRPSSWWP